MSLEIIKKYYRAFNQKNIEAILALCSDDVINDPNQGDSQFGKEKFKLFMETAWTYFDEQVSDLVLMSNVDESKIASEYTVHGTYYKTKEGLFPSTNQKYEISPVTVFTIKNQKIIRMTRFYNTKKWLDIVNPARA